MLLENLHLALFIHLCKTVYTLSNTELDNSSPGIFVVPCEEGWYYFGGQCYKIRGYGNDDPVTWEEASNRCGEMGAKLASIHSKKEDDFIGAFLALNMMQFPWIGLNDRAEESSFVWEDGSPVDYENWQPGMPDNHKGVEHCVEIVFYPWIKDTVLWNDISCDAKKAYVCQKESNNLLQSQDPRFCSDDSEGGWKFRGSCFHLVPEKKSWEDAEHYCQNRFNGHLAMILDDASDFFIKKSVLPRTCLPIWLGLKTQNKFQQMWTTGWPVYYGYFDEHLENIQRGTCILRLYPTAWISVPCDEKHEFLCEKVKPPALKKPAAKSKCPELPNNWRDFGGEFCYYIEKKRKLNWHGAKAACIERGGTLASIHSKEEEEILQPFIKSSSSVFIGLNSLETNGNIYVWSDGSTLDYTHWGPTEPNNPNEMCVEMNTRHLTWNDISCGKNSEFICQVRKVLQISPTDNSGETKKEEQFLSQNSPIGDSGESKKQEESENVSPTVIPATFLTFLITIISIMLLAENF